MLATLYVPRVCHHVCCLSGATAVPCAACVTRYPPDDVVSFLPCFVQSSKSLRGPMHRWWRGNARSFLWSIYPAWPAKPTRCSLRPIPTFRSPTKQQNQTSPNPVRLKATTGTTAAVAGSVPATRIMNARLSDAKTWTTDGTTPVGDRHSLQQQEKKKLSFSRQLRAGWALLRRASAYTT